MPIKTAPIDVLVLVAGMNDPSNSQLLAEEFAYGIKEIENLHTETLHVRDLKLEHFDLHFYEKNADQGEEFSKLQASVARAKGIVIATPIWNFSVPSHLKNLIDRLGSFCLDTETRSKGTLGGKPVYLIFTGGAGQFVWNTVMENSTSHVREAMKYFGGTVVGTHFEPKCVLPDGTFGLVVDQRKDELQLLKKKGHDFGQIVSDFAMNGKLPTATAAKGIFYRTAGWFVKKFT